MPQSLSYLFKTSCEFVPAEQAKHLPSLLRGLYVLYENGTERTMNVVYVGMARGERTGMKGRILEHLNTKAGLWTHFSVFEVWDNITKEQIEELEGLFRHMYRRDAAANKLNRQKGHGPLHKLRRLSLSGSTAGADR
jgi:hypothetical protein